MIGAELTAFEELFSAGWILFLRTCSSLCTHTDARSGSGFMGRLHNFYLVRLWVPERTKIDGEDESESTPRSRVSVLLCWCLWGRRSDLCAFLRRVWGAIPWRLSCLSSVQLCLTNEEWVTCEDDFKSTNHLLLPPQTRSCLCHSSFWRPVG